VKDERNETMATSGCCAGTLLYVTDFAGDSQKVLEFAGELADRYDARLELLYITDPEHTPSRPDAQMGVQYTLEALARSLKHLKNNARALLLFGNPEHVISKRAADTNATLITFPLSGSESDRVLKRLARRLTKKCACPVLIFPPNVRKEDTNLLSLKRCISFTRRACEGRLY
jgi:nucleotide-binding universal stress UspA family protein